MIKKSRNFRTFLDWDFSICWEFQHVHTQKVSIMSWLLNKSGGWSRQSQPSQLNSWPDLIDAHRGGGGEGGNSCTPYKDFEKLPHKNAIKTTPPQWFSHNPNYPPQKNLPKTRSTPWISNYCASMPDLVLIKKSRLRISKSLSRQLRPPGLKMINVLPWCSSPSSSW